MRPGQNKRMRGRNNNGGNGGNRKGPNPLTRSYESNGPDVKIRGTAHHVGEKYLQLARDAQSSGDPVMAESYLQHAEHYFRLIAAAQQAQQQAAYGYQRPAGEQVEAEDDGEDDDFSSLPDRFASPAERVVTPPPQPAPQPYVERPAYNGGDRPSYEPRQDRYERSGQSGERHNGERQPQQDRPFQDRPQQADRGGERFDRNGNRGERQPYGERPANRNQDRGQERNQERGQDRGQDRAPDSGAAGGQNRDYDNRGPRNGRGRDFRDQPREFRDQRQPEAEPATVGALPAFITAPVRVQPEPGHEPQGVATAAPPSEASVPTSDDPGFAPRRRRRVKAEFAEAGNEPQATPDPVGE